MDRLEAMRLLVEVVKTGSMSAASRTQSMPLPTLSRKITMLEQQLGTKLLTRTTRKISLTDTGAAYVEAARHILERVEDAERLAAGEFVSPTGTLVVAAPMHFGRLYVLPIIVDFLAAHPLIDVRLLLADRNVHLVDEQVDMAVRVGELPDSSMVATRVGSMRTVVCGSPGFFAGRGVPYRPMDLLQLPCIGLELPTPSAHWRFYQSGALPLEVPIVPRLSVTTTDAAVQAAICGVGVARLLHYQIYDAVAAGLLHTVLEPYEPQAAPIHLVHVARGQMPIKMRRFIDFAAPSLKHRLAKLTFRDSGRQQP